MKKRGVLIACLALGTTVSVSAFTHKVISANIKSQTISYKGNITNQEVIEYNNTTYVPLRSFSELVGIPVDYQNGSIHLGATTTNANMNTTNSLDSVMNNGSNVYIGETKAKNIALQHAGVQENNVTITKLKLDKDDNRLIYEVEFFTGNKEYDYEIDAVTENIVSYDYDIEGFQIPTLSTNGSYIGKEKAEQIALEHAQLTKEQVRYVENKLDSDDGKWKYEIEFKYGSNEYDYEINAYTGEIIDFSVDYD